MLTKLSQPPTSVLVVDDERVIADTFAMILNQNGFDATAAYSGEQAVELAGNLRPAIILSDVMMGQMNGIEASLLIRLLLPECKVLLFSGQPAVAELLESAARQGHSFEILAKPVHPDVILQKVRNLSH